MTPSSSHPIAPAGRAEAALLAALHALAFPKEAWSTTAMADLLATPGVMGFLAPGGGTAPEGLALTRIAADEAEILTLGVVPSARNRGVGGRLLEAAIAAVTSQGACALFLEVAVDNLQALRLYAGRGFLEVGRRPGYYARDGGTRQDALILQLAIGGNGAHHG